MKNKESQWIKAQQSDGQTEISPYLKVAQLYRNKGQFQGGKGKVNSCRMIHKRLFFIFEVTWEKQRLNKQINKCDSSG